MAIYIIFIILQYGAKVKQIFRIGEDHGYRNNTLLFTVFSTKSAFSGRNPPAKDEIATR